MATLASTTLLVALVASAPGCGSDNPDLFVQPYDAGSEADAPKTDAASDIDPTLGGPCSEDVQCDDAIPCTFDRCDTTLSRCRNVPDDSLCADDVYCNGIEKCVLRLGCAAGPVVTCQDDSICTLDRCVEETKSCEHAERDVDGDGDPDDHCIGSRDCDDLDPTVSSQKTEVCDNFKDDDCDGEIDEQPCARAANDVCATALTVTNSGTFLLTSVAARRDYATSCNVKKPTAAQDLVVAITVPGVAGDPPKDVEVWPRSQLTPNEVAVALQATCGDAASEVSCGHVDGVANARAIARSVPAGTTIYAVITTQAEAPVDVKVDIRAATTKPTNESCAAPTPVTIDVPTTVSLVDPAKDLATGCGRSQTGELTYSFTLDEPRDVKIFASTLVGTGDPVVTLRDDACTDELRCRVGTTPPVFARSLAAGTHVFAVSGTTQIDASVLVKTYPPTTPPANQTCATATEVPRDTSFIVDLSGQEDAIPNGCLAGGPAAAYALTLTEPSDVLVIGRFPFNELGAVSINAPGCKTADLVACAASSTPARVSRRNLPAGNYRIVVADERGQNAELTVFVRKATAPTTITGADGCTTAGAIPAEGGFFTGDTTGSTGNFNAGCDAPGIPLGGAPDQILKLDLAQQRRVVFDMSGSSYTTLLDIREGATCPGTEVANACYVGFGPGRSFLDMKLGPGTFWVQVDGYAGNVGTYNLDVRVLPP